MLEFHSCYMEIVCFQGRCFCRYDEIIIDHVRIPVVQNFLSKEVISWHRNFIVFQWRVVWRILCTNFNYNRRGDGCYFSVVYNAQLLLCNKVMYRVLFFSRFATSYENSTSHITLPAEVIFFILRKSLKHYFPRRISDLATRVVNCT